MNEARQMYDDLLEALSPILPRTVYQDVRRVRTLGWAVTGLCLTHTVRLGAWAEVVESRAQYAASRVRRLSRWLHHRAIHPQEWYQPVLQAALVDWQQASRLYIALDTTALTPFVLIRASLVYCHRAIPLAWRAMRHKSTQVGFEAYQPVLDQVRAIVPPGLVITLLADRGFVHEQLLHYLHTQQWHFRLRLPGDTLVHLKAQPVTAIRDLCPPAGERRFFQEVSILGTAVGPVSLALACLLDQPDDPWFVVSDEQTSAQTLDEYGLRFDIEEAFLDEKSGGYQIHTSKLATPEALERLLLIVAIATLHLTSIGAGVVRAGKHRWVDTHWDRGMSYLKLGWRWRQQHYQRGWQAFVPFWLDPAPDPLPVPASRRAVLGGKKDVDLPTAV
jgi:Transposase DDE domain